MDQSDDKPETLKVIDKMLHTVISYEQGRERLEPKGRALKIREDDYRRKLSKSAAKKAANEKPEDIDPSKSTQAIAIAEPPNEAIEDQNDSPERENFPIPKPDLIPRFELDNPPPAMSPSSVLPTSAGHQPQDS